MTVYADFEIHLRSVGNEYAVDLRVRRTRDQLRIAPLSGQPLPVFSVTNARLKALLHDPAEYGLALGQLLFAEPILREFDAYLSAASQSGAYLRVSLEIDASATALDALHWEMLCHPEKKFTLASHGAIRFSRFLQSASHRALAPRPRAQLRVLAVVASPNDAKEWELDPIDTKTELQIAEQGFAGFDLELLGGTSGPATRLALQTAMQRGVDVLYIAAHGGLIQEATGSKPVLYLQHADGGAASLSADAFIADLEQLPHLPRLIILVACRSADAAASASLARLLGEAGAPAVVAMQGDLSMPTAHAFIPPLLASLQRDEPIDAAVAAGRAAALSAERGDWWMPALFSRISDGQIWQATDKQLLQKVESWLHMVVPKLQPQQLQPLAAAIVACPAATQLSFADLASLPALCVELEFWDAGKAPLLHLQHVLHECGLLLPITWAELAALQRLLADLPLTDKDLIFLYGRCRPAGAFWEAPLGRNTVDTLQQMLAMLAAAQPAGGKHPLVEFVRLLLNDLAHLVAPLVSELRAWEEAVTRRLELGPPLAVAQPGNPPQPSLVIQLSLAPGVVNPDLTQPATIDIFLDVWLWYDGHEHVSKQLATREKHTLHSASDRFTALEKEARKLAHSGLGQLLIQFVLPLELLPHDVEHWSIKTSDYAPPLSVGYAQPVVVRSLDRLLKKHREALLPLWKERWKKRLVLKAETLESALVLIDNPATYRFMKVQAALLRSEKLLLLQTANPFAKSDELLGIIDTAVAAGLPALLFVRQGCQEPAKTSEQIRKEMAQRQFDQLPGLVYDQRQLALEEDNHYGERLTLLWDDPERLPVIIEYENEQL
jgi:hypothetical protein